jgi:hypothetical protein
MRIRFGLGRHYGRRVGLALPESVGRCPLRFGRIAGGIPFLHSGYILRPHYLLSAAAGAGPLREGPGLGGGIYRGFGRSDGLPSRNGGE